MKSNLRSLIAKLDRTCRSALEGAAGLCLSRTHYEVDIEHLLLKLLDDNNTDLHRIFHHFGINTSRLASDLTAVIDDFKSGNTRTPVFSPRLLNWFEEAWVTASVEYGEARVRSGHLLVALLSSSEMSRMIRESSTELDRISLEELKRRLAELAEGSDEAAEVGERLGSGTPSAQPLPTEAAKLGKTPALDQYTINLTLRAKSGGIDPVLGRDAEIRQMIDILNRRRQNNPILTGEAGVGKTAVVEGLALRIAQGDVPSALSSVALHTLDLGLLQAGASVRGEFEKRLRSVMDEVKASPHPIVLFIDEAHTLIGAGGPAGQSDAANLLKPALARGELRTIAATTWSEYKKYFEKDAALARRFQVVKVDEPTEEQCVIMLRGLTERMEAHHNVRVLDGAIEEAVRLSHRYLSGRQLPDKAVSVLDTACARVAVGQSATPAAIEDARRRVESIATKTRILEREMAAGLDHGERIHELSEVRRVVQKDLATLEKRWTAERELVGRIRDVRTRLEQQASRAASYEAPTASKGYETSDEGTAVKTDPTTLRQQLAQLTSELEALQDESPLVPVCVDGPAVAEVISNWTGIPVRKMVKDEIKTVLSLKQLLEARVIGQSHALEAIAKRIQTARAGLEDPGKPIGVFLLVGPSGVGKTETALALADTLYGGERNMVAINMSEYQEAHTVSGLKGSPPGYVGYGEGGVLTEAVRRKPYCVVLLDEVEKAHPDVLELFFQVFDKGFMEDAEGRDIDFKNTVILLTSNIGTDTIMSACLATETQPDAEALTETLRRELQAAFKPAFLGRLVIIPYYPLRDGALRKVVELKLDRVRRRITDSHRAELVWDDAVVDALVARCTDIDSGARNIDYILTSSILPEISETVLARLATGEAVKRIELSASEGHALSYAII